MEADLKALVSAGRSGAEEARRAGPGGLLSLVNAAAADAAASPASSLAPVARLIGIRDGAAAPAPDRAVHAVREALGRCLGAGGGRRWAACAAALLLRSSAADPASARSGEAASVLARALADELDTATLERKGPGGAAGARTRAAAHGTGRGGDAGAAGAGRSPLRPMVPSIAGLLRSVGPFLSPGAAADVRGRMCAAAHSSYAAWAGASAARLAGVASEHTALFCSFVLAVDGVSASCGAVAAAELLDALASLEFVRVAFSGYAGLVERLLGQDGVADAFFERHWTAVRGARSPAMCAREFFQLGAAYSWAVSGAVPARAARELVVPACVACSGSRVPGVARRALLAAGALLRVEGARPELERALPLVCERAAAGLGTTVKRRTVEQFLLALVRGLPPGHAVPLRALGSLARRGDKEGAAAVVRLAQFLPAGQVQEALRALGDAVDSAPPGAAAAAEMVDAATAAVSAGYNLYVREGVIDWLLAQRRKVRAARSKL